MRFAYADPPYFGCAVKHYGERAAEFDTVGGQQAVVDRISGFDGWALSMSSKNLLDLAPQLRLPPDARVAAWCKPFVFFRPGLANAYAWEPVLFSPLRSKGDVTTRDWCAVNTTFGRGLAGAKPVTFCLWLLDLVGARSEDEFEDLFPGTGSFGAAVAAFRQRLPLKASVPTRGRRYEKRRGLGGLDL